MPLYDGTPTLVPGELRLAQFYNKKRNQMEVKWLGTFHGGPGAVALMLNGSPASSAVAKRLC